MVKKRSSISELDKWDIKRMFSSIQEWQNAFGEIKQENKKEQFSDLLSYKGKLKDSAEMLSACLEKYFDTIRSIEKLYTYAHLFLDEDLSNDSAKQIFAKVSNLYSEFQTSTSWIEPEILQIDETLLDKYMKEGVCKDFVFYIEKLLKLKPHTLPEAQEKILARSNQSLDVCHLVFSSFNNADIKFGNIKDSNKKSYPLSHASYLVYVKSQDRVLRKNAFEGIHQKYLDYENTLGELLYGEVKNDHFVSESRNYKSSLEAALFPNNIDTKVYFNLIEAVRKNIISLHKFTTLKKKKLNLDKVHLYDLYPSIAKDVDMKISYKEAKDLVIESVAPLGEEYQEMLKTGLFKDRWVDVYETENKKSGAYSSGCYDSPPYVLLNFEGTLNDLLTLAHECGHSMHTLLSNQSQKYYYSRYPIFLAEIASTFNEQLLLDLLMQRAKTKDEKAYLLSNMIDRINATLFRQTLFAQFELEIHNLQQKGIPITPHLLKSKYEGLYKFYYGKDFEVDDFLKIEWARIPHFYSSFYVYQYAIGISVALSFYKRVKKNAEYKNKYLSFLKKGGSDYPLNILKEVDIDLSEPICIEEAIGYFDELIENFKF